MRLRHPQPDPSISTKTYRRIISGHAPPAWGTSHPGSADQLKDGQRSSKHSNPEEESDGGAENGSNRGDDGIYPERFMVSRGEDDDVNINGKRKSHNNEGVHRGDEPESPPGR